MELTQEIITPFEGKKVVIKTMLTGAEREQVDNAQMKFVKTKDGTNVEVADMVQLNLAQKHELIRISIVSIDGDISDCFQRWHKMYEPDNAFVYNQIVETQKKMMESITPTSS